MSRWTEYNARRAKVDPEFKARRAQLNLESKKRTRREVIETYGGRCVCCGETTYEFLCIDHVNGGGNRERKRLGMGGWIYYKIKREKYPTSYQILCHNCNFAKSAYGKCPHQDLVLKMDR